MPTKSSTETSRVITFYWGWMGKSNSVSRASQNIGDWKGEGWKKGEGKQPLVDP